MMNPDREPDHALKAPIVPLPPPAELPSSGEAIPRLKIGDRLKLGLVLVSGG